MVGFHRPTRRTLSSNSLRFCGAAAGALASRWVEHDDDEPWGMQRRHAAAAGTRRLAAVSSAHCKRLQLFWHQANDAASKQPVLQGCTHARKWQRQVARQHEATHREAVFGQLLRVRDLHFWCLVLRIDERLGLAQNLFRRDLQAGGAAGARAGRQRQVSGGGGGPGRRIGGRCWGGSPRLPPPQLACVGAACLFFTPVVRGSLCSLAASVTPAV